MKIRFNGMYNIKTANTNNIKYTPIKKKNGIDNFAIKILNGCVACDLTSTQVPLSYSSLNKLNSRTMITSGKRYRRTKEKSKFPINNKNGFLRSESYF